MNLEAEDYFQDSLSSVFRDIVVCHGDQGEDFVFRSNRFGELRLRVARTETWDDTLLFAHFGNNSIDGSLRTDNSVWNAGLKIAGMIDDKEIDVTDKTVLDIGAGTGVAGILSILDRAGNTVLSDYDATFLLENLRHNLATVLPPELHGKGTVVGHIWGEDVTKVMAANAGHPFDIILLADCLWMPEQHKNLVQTLCSLLKKERESVIYCVAGFHTGRAKIARFFVIASAYGLVPTESIVEIGVDDKMRRWDTETAEEDSVERKRWLVVARLVWSREYLRHESASTGPRTTNN